MRNHVLGSRLVAMSPKDYRRLPDRLRRHCLPHLGTQGGGPGTPDRRRAGGAGRHHIVSATGQRAEQKSFREVLVRSEARREGKECVRMGIYRWVTFKIIIKTIQIISVIIKLKKKIKH